MKLIRGLVFVMGSLLVLSACDEAKQSGDGDQAAAPVEADATTDAETETTVDPFEEHAALFSEEYKAYAQRCIAATSIQGGNFKFYSGFVDAATTFSNYAVITMGCESGDITTLLNLADALNQINPQGFLDLLSSLEVETGLDTHFQTVVDSTTVAAADNLTITNSFWNFRPEGSFFISTFDASATTFTDGVNTPSSITFTYGDQTVQSDVTVYSYTQAQIDLGQARYNAAFTDENGVESPSCASCHQAANGVDHSPLLIGTCSDVEIIGAVEAGAYAPDADNPNSFCAGYQLTVAHSWGFASPEERDGVIAYLRTLPLNITPPAAE
ncbi:hypothetical protein [Pseudobacteriovorax antillogorgiicola]|uniref:Cytochrome c domain-containing protein n=1 Tax=Pseudobacteriovorax antillogorgiicola TaxID=1513793 RepID=A0A1Y6CAY8_9BACT|nr:hypothetical protein [Pseudobacteriovorax antillogorgiicola]TCS49036.1 hypothetical protein EDD56_11679 [Pseudobacteriovorax antillogorgiicola]SMF52688.1 hypothetical protein SAMN06296036_11675 [Pseudobacteriovorax antillogorgiicola]